MRTSSTSAPSLRFALIIGFAAVAHAPSGAAPAVIVLDLGGAARSWITGGEKAAPNLCRFVSEGVAILDLAGAGSPSPHEALRELLGSAEPNILDRFSNRSWLLVPAARPFGDLAGQGHLCAADGSAPPLRSLQERFGLPGPLRAGEAIIAREVRQRFGPPLDDVDAIRAASLCAGVVPERRDPVLLAFAGDLLARPPDLTVILLLDPGDETRERDAAFAAKERFFGDAYRALGAADARSEAIFAYVALPRSLASDPLQASRASGCAVLWGKPFRRGVVSIAPVPWLGLRSTIAVALGATPRAEGDAPLRDLLGG